MLENYLKAQNEEEQRLIATQAALEIIKASVSAPTGYDGREKLDRDIKHVVANLSVLTDAIQETLKAE